jgi:hypothetical protein
LRGQGTSGGGGGVSNDGGSRGNDRDVDDDAAAAVDNDAWKYDDNNNNNNHNSQRVRILYVGLGITQREIVELLLSDAKLSALCVLTVLMLMCAYIRSLPLVVSSQQSVAFSQQSVVSSQ